MKELSNKELMLVVGGGRGDSGGETTQDRYETVKLAANVARWAWNRSWGKLLSHSAELNAGEQEFLDNMRREQGREERRHGYNNRQGHYRREGGGRLIER